MLTSLELEVRRHTVGSSDVPTICGLNPFKERSSVLEAKLDPRKAEDTTAFRMGHAVERIVADEALTLKKVPAKILQPGWTVVQDEWMSCTPDFWGLRTGTETFRKGRPLSEEEALILECKNVGWRLLAHWDYGKKLPDYVAAQVQWQMMILRHRQAYVAAWLGGSEVETFHVKADEVWIGLLVEECRAFWETHLAPGKRDKIKHRVKLEQLRSRIGRDRCLTSTLVR